MNPFTQLAAFVDRTTMYRMVLYGTGSLSLIAIILGFTGLIFYSGFSLVGSLLVIAVAAFASNFILAKVCKAVSNLESVVITVLILFLIMEPAETGRAFLELGFIAVIAMASKYVVAYKKQHLINPAAFGATFAWLFGIGAATWWVASVELLVPALIAGFLVVWKIRRWYLVGTFVFVGLAFFLLESLSIGGSLVEGATLYILSWPTIFLATIMLTEPFTTPPTKALHVAYGALVATLMSTGFITGFTIPPEAALVIGNLAFWPTTLRQKLLLELDHVNTVAKDTIELVFKKPAGFTHLSGQYLEWMLPHTPTDQRGIRRYFTIASAPTETMVRLGVRLSDKDRHPGSAYKTALQNLKENEVVIASQIAGDFLLPKDETQKLVFIAGGIGMTPFRSHLKYLVDTNEARDIVMFYCNRTPEDIAYRDVIEEAKRTLTLSVVHMISDESSLSRAGSEEIFKSGFITNDTILEHVPDFKERMFYISGSPGMVGAYTGLLRGMGVPKRNIVLDYFPGLA